MCEQICDTVVIVAAIAGFTCIFIRALKFFETV
jgi:hypothetical protein